MSKTIEMAFGKKGMKIALPGIAKPTIIKKRPLPVPDDPGSLIDQALEEPTGSPRLEVAAKGAATACILICDITRPVPNHLFLRKLVSRLEAAGINRQSITILVATGLHRPNLGDELAELVGDPWVMDNIRIENHDAEDDAIHVMLGQTQGRGVPVGIDERFANADIRIATGLVEPHFMAGWSGGRKVIAPGVAHHTTIRTFHSARFMEDPLATSCNLAGNPLHEEQLSIVAMLKNYGSKNEILALNTVIDEERNLVFASFGEIMQSHKQAVDFVHKSAAVAVGRRFNTIVTSAAGYPLDKTYYQTVKGMVTPIDILEPGGDLIIVSECSEGIGSQSFRAAQERLVELGPKAFLASLMGKSLADIDEWQTEMQLKAMRVGRIILYSPSLGDEGHAITGVDRVDDVSRAIQDAIARHGDDDVAVIPEGPYVIPFAGKTL